MLLHELQLSYKVQKVARCHILSGYCVSMGDQLTEI